MFGHESREYRSSGDTVFPKTFNCRLRVYEFELLSRRLQSPPAVRVAF